MGNNGPRGLPFYSIPMPLRSLHSFCSVRSHLLKSVERQILHIWEQREYHHMEGTEEAWNMNMSMGGSKPHACMHACNMQHSHVHMDTRNTHAPMRHTTHDATHTLTLKCSTYSLRPWNTVHLEIYTLTRAYLMPKSSRLMCACDHWDKNIKWRPLHAVIKDRHVAYTYSTSWCISQSISI